MKRFAMIVALSLVFTSPSVFAYTGNELLQHFEGDTAARNYASGFVDGEVAALDADGSICVPKVMNKQIRDVVKKFLQENPAKRHEPAVLLVLMAIAEAWPCPKEQQ